MLKNKIGFIAGSAAMLAVAVSSLSFAGDSFQDEINTINAAIKQSGAQWQAGETSMSRLSKEERAHRVGYNFEKFKAKPLVTSKAYTATSIPSSVDWRDMNGQNFVTPVRDQGQCGSCWAFSMTAGLEAYTLIKNNTPGQDLDLSEQVLISCSGIGSCDGGTINPDYLQSTGLPAESAYPYTATDGTCSDAQQGWQNNTYKIDGWGSIDQTATALKQAIATYGPIPAAFEVYSDFMNYKSGVYSYTSGTLEGGHAIFVVGYNDSGKYFIVKNSWGTGWGEDGFFRIAYSQVTSSKVKFGMSAVAYQGAKSQASDSNDYSAKLQQSTAAFNSDDTMKRIQPILNQVPQ